MKKRFTSGCRLRTIPSILQPHGKIQPFLIDGCENVTLCLASATAMKQVKYALEYHGMAKYFDVVLSCADIGVGKDQPDIYLLAQEKLGVPAEELCVFEDSYVALETAKRSAFKPLAFTTNTTSSSKDSRKPPTSICPRANR